RLCGALRAGRPDPGDEFAGRQTGLAQQRPLMLGDLGACALLQPLARPGQHLVDRLGDAVWLCRFDHFLDLAGGSAVGVPLDRGRDLPPHRQVVVLQRGTDLRGGPELDRTVVVGPAARLAGLTGPVVTTLTDPAFTTGHGPAFMTPRHGPGLAGT